VKDDFLRDLEELARSEEGSSALRGEGTVPRGGASDERSALPSAAQAESETMRRSARDERDHALPGAVRAGSETMRRSARDERSPARGPARDERDALAGQLAAALVPAAEGVSSEGPRARLMAALVETSRFERFGEAVSQILDIEHRRALRLLEKLEERALFDELMPGIELLWVDGGPRVENAVRGFVRVAAGLEFPEHQHHGEERLLVLQGSFYEPTQGRVFRPGDICVMPEGSRHSHTGPADGPDLLVLTVIDKGVSVGEQRFSPNQVPTNVQY
jgi:quercetin dioxygenase-like cupin family protein